MAFPTSPADYATHSEDGVDFYAKGGKWLRKSYPQFGVMGDSRSPTNCVAAGHDNFTLWMPSLDMDRPRNMIVARAAFRPAASCDVRIGFFDAQTNGWIPLSNYQDPSGIVQWGEGSPSGAATNNWRSFRAFVLNSFWANSSHSTRKLKANRPQIVKLWIMRNGANGMVVAWHYAGQCVSSDVMIRTYGKMDINIPIHRVSALNVALSDGTFEDGRFSAEIF